MVHRQLKIVKYLNRLGMAEITPVDKNSKEETFTALADSFKFDDKIKALFLDGPMENLEDFRFYFAEETEVDAFVASEKSVTGTQQRLQISRVKRAWTAVRQNGLRKEKRNTVSSVAEMDDLLEEGTLRDVQVQYWKRYKMKYPVEVNPSDQLLSRVYREMEKRLLTVYDIWKVKTLKHQVMSTKKRKQVGTDLYMFEDEAEEKPEAHKVEKYLALLHTYLLALSIAGSSKVHGAPVDEAFGCDAAKFVKVPWDVLQAYHFRASRTAMLVPEASRLTWLEERDIEERSAWVSQYREGDEYLGQVVQAIMEKRGAHWDTPIYTSVMRTEGNRQQQPQRHEAPQTPTRQKRGQQKGLAKGSSSRQRMTVRRRWQQAQWQPSCATVRNFARTSTKVSALLKAGLANTEYTSVLKLGVTAGLVAWLTTAHITAAPPDGAPVM